MGTPLFDKHKANGERGNLVDRMKASGTVQS